ncbi:MAG: P6 [Corparats virus 1]|nr:MAG: P6 [Corparats virus 1]
MDPLRLILGELLQNEQLQDKLHLWPKNILNYEIKSRNEIKKYVKNSNLGNMLGLSKIHDENLLQNNTTLIFPNDKVLSLHNTFKQIYQRNGNAIPNVKALGSLLLGLKTKILLESKVVLTVEVKDLLRKDNKLHLTNFEHNPNVDLIKNKVIRKNILKKQEPVLVAMTLEDIQNMTNNDLNTNRLKESVMMLTIEEVVNLQSFNNEKTFFLLHIFNGPKFVKYLHPVYNVLSNVIPTLSISDINTSKINIKNNYYRKRYKCPITSELFLMNPGLFRKEDHVIVFNSKIKSAKSSALQKKLKANGWRTSILESDAYTWEFIDFKCCGYPVYFITKISHDDYSLYCQQYSIDEQIKLHPNYYLLLNSTTLENISVMIPNIIRTRIEYKLDVYSEFPSEHVVGRRLLNNFVSDVVKVKKGINVQKMLHQYLIVIGDKGSGKSICTSYFISQLNQKFRNDDSMDNYFYRIDSDAYGKWIKKVIDNKLSINNLNKLELDELNENHDDMSIFEQDMIKLINKHKLNDYGNNSELERIICDEFLDIAYNRLSDQETGLATFYKLILNITDLPYGIVIESHTNVELAKLPGTGYILDLKVCYDCESAIVNRIRKNVTTFVDLLLYRAWNKLHVMTYPTIHSWSFFNKIDLNSETFEIDDTSSLSTYV